MARKIVITLDEQSIDAAIKWANEEKKKIVDTIHNFIQMLMDEGVAIAKANVVNIDTGETINSIHGFFRDNLGVIVAGGNAVWLEFGTGVTKNDFYPEQVEGIVPIGTYGKHKGSNPNGWYYYDKEEGKVKHTFGIKSNRFMLYAKEHLTSIAPQWANDLFKGI